MTPPPSSPCTNRFVQSIIRSNNMAVGAAAAVLASSAHCHDENNSKGRRALRAALVMLQSGLEKIQDAAKLRTTISSSDTMSCSSSRSDIVTVDTIVIAESRLKAENTFQDDHQALGFFNRALTMTFNDHYHAAQRDLCDELIGQLAAVLVYNIGFFCHCSALLNRNAAATNYMMSKKLRRAATYYQKAEDFLSSNDDSSLLIRLSLQNNVSHALSSLAPTNRQSKECLMKLQSFFQNPQVTANLDGYLKEEDLDFFMDQDVFAYALRME
jgi:hypothetical protein